MDTELQQMAEATKAAIVQELDRRIAGIEEHITQVGNNQQLVGYLHKYLEEVKQKRDSYAKKGINEHG